MMALYTMQFTVEELEFLQGVLSGMQFQGDAPGIRKILALHEAVMGKVMAQLEERSAPRSSLDTPVMERRAEKAKR